MNARLNETIDTILSHRSIRRFTDKSIDADILELLIQSGQAAASSSFIQAYSIIRVTDKKYREQIAEAAGGQQYVNDAAEFLVFCADLKRIGLACKQHDAGELQGHTEHFIAATVDVALVAQNVLLAAESIGLGGVFIGGIRNDPQLITDLLHLPDQVYPVFGMCLGWPDVDPDVKPRFPFNNILHQNQYSINNLDRNIETYDKKMQAYYEARSTNNKATNWSTQTAQAIQLKQRPFMLEFLNKQGLLRK